MKRDVRFRAEAEVDLREAISWYDAEREGLGDELCERFPYAIYFRETDEVVQVFAVFHARRDPRELRKKLSK